MGLVLRGTAALIAVATVVGVAQESRNTARVPSFAGCFPAKPTTRPVSILVACGDGNLFIAKITWSTWTVNSARGTGVAHENNCVPDCARGRFHTYRVSVRLSRPARCQNGRLEFTRFMWTYLTVKPPNSSRSGSQKSPFYNGAGCS